MCKPSSRLCNAIIPNYQELNASETNITANTQRNLTTMIDRNGNRYEYVHNIRGMLLEERRYSNRDINPDDPVVFVTSHTYSQDALLLTSTNPEGDSVSFLYDSSNPLRVQQRNLLSSTNTPGARGASQAELVESFTYEPVYNLVKTTTNARGFSTSHLFDYQHEDNLSALASELGISEAQVTSLMSAVGMTMTGGVNGQINGNIIRTDFPSATLSEGSTQSVYKTYHFNHFGQMIEQVDAEGIVTDFEYYAENDPDGDTLASVSGRTLSTDTGGYRKAVVRDSRIDARRTRSGPALAIRTEAAYDEVGNKVRGTDGRGNSTRFIYNQLNQLVRKIAPAPFEYLTDYYYDANNNLVRVSEQNVGTSGPNLTGWVHTVYRHNTLNRKTSEIQTPAKGVQLETLYEYDANENVVAVQEPEGNRIARVYDERDLVFQSTRGAGSESSSTQTMHYDGNGNLLRVIDAVDNTGDGNPESTLFTYDGYNRLLQSTDAEGNRMAYQYDANSNKELQRHFGNSGIAGIDNEILLAETLVSFDELDRAYQRDDSLLVNGQAQNVGAGLSPDDNQVTGVRLFDANGLVVRSTDDNGNQIVHSYDGLNRRNLVVDANGNNTNTVFDNNNNAIQTTETQVNVGNRLADKAITTTATYDELNRKVTNTDALGNITRYRYDSRNNLIQTNDALGNVTLAIYDGINRLLETREYLAIDGTGDSTLDKTNPTNIDAAISAYYAYDGNSRLVFQGDDNSNATGYQYDALNRRFQTDYADGTKVSVSFDADNNAISSTDQNGSVFSHQYDGLNRLTATTVVPASGVVGSTAWAYSYDGLSRRISASDNNDPSLSSDNSTVEYRYNSLNYLLSETNNGLAASASYDGLGNRQQLNYPGGRVLDYDYDAIYNLKAITDTTGGASDNVVEYDFAARRVLERRYGNGTKLSYIGAAANDMGYDGINRVLQHHHSNAAEELIAGFDYAYDKVHNRRYEVDQFAQLADVYEYDSTYRVIRAAYRVAANDATLQAVSNNNSTNADVAGIISPQDESYLLDGVGNRASLQTVEGDVSDAVGYQSNAMNEYTRIGAVEQSHDANGNLTSDGERSYHFDAKNRLLRVSTLGGNTIASYKYDAFGRRIEKRAGSETVRYMHFAKRVLEERGIFSQLQRQYVYGSWVDEVLQLRNAANEDFYYHGNSIGSIAAITNGSGDVVERYRYSAYGETTVLEADGVTELDESSVDNAYGFTGRRFDPETGFYYYRARYYAPERGRFVQRDPLGYADGMGVYVYVNGNPINMLDPFGLESITISSYPGGGAGSGSGGGWGHAWVSGTDADGNTSSAGSWPSESAGSESVLPWVDYPGSVTDSPGDRDGYPEDKYTDSQIDSVTFEVTPEQYEKYQDFVESAQKDEDRRWSLRDNCTDFAIEAAKEAGVDIDYDDASNLGHSDPAELAEWIKEQNKIQEENKDNGKSQ